MTLPQVWTLGEALAALTPTETGPLEHIGRMDVRVGGSELNVAIGLARLDHPVTWTGVVGDDPWGRRVLRELRAEGVTVHHRTAVDSFTALYLRERRAGHATQATYIRRGSAGSLLSVGDLRRLRPSTGDIVHLSGITPALSESACHAWLCAAAKAKEAGARLSLDVNFRARLWSPTEARRTLGQIARRVDMLFASPAEAEVLLGDAAEDVDVLAEQTQSRLAPGGEVIMKVGPAGSLHLAPNGTRTTASALSVSAIDPVGAGDAFAAGYLSASLDGLTTRERLERAHACAAYVVASSGDWEGLPRRDELSRSHLLLQDEVQR